MQKVYTYETYLDAEVQPVLSVEKCQEILGEIIESINTQDEDLMEIWEEVLGKCFRYQKMRMDWSLYSREEKMERDSLRTSYHDSVIIGFNMLSRYMDQQDISISWREKLGENRKCIGDFACYVGFIYAINNR